MCRPDDGVPVDMVEVDEAKKTGDSFSVEAAMDELRDTMQGMASQIKDLTGHVEALMAMVEQLGSDNGDG